MAKQADVKVQRMTVVPNVPSEAKGVEDPNANIHFLSPETMQRLHEKVTAVHTAQRQVCLIDVQIERLKDEKRRAHAKVKVLDSEVTTDVHEEAKKLGIDVKDPQCPWTFNIDTGVFQKNTAQE